MELLTFVNAIRSRSVRQKSQHTTEFEWRRKLASTFFFSKRKGTLRGSRAFSILVVLLLESAEEKGRRRNWPEFPLYYYVRIQYGYYIYKHWSAPLHLEQRLLYYLAVMNLLYYYHVCIYVRVPKLIHLCKCKYRKCNTYDTTKYWLLTATKCNLSYVMQYRVMPRHRKHKACSVILSNVFAGYIFSGIHLDWNLLWRIKE